MSGTGNQHCELPRGSNKVVPVKAGFEPLQLKIMGFAAVILTCCIIFYLFQNVARLETNSARVLVCLMVSLLLGIFFFVWWPAHFELTAVPIINLPMRVVGPVALWLAILTLLMNIMPREDAPYRSYSLVNAPNGQLHYHRGIRIVRPEGVEVEFDLIESRSEPGRLKNILVRFRSGEEDISANLLIPRYKPLSVVFRRSEGLIDVSNLEYGKDQQ
jgi:hypothetical protein